MTHTLTVATANTHEARMLHDPDGLRPFTEREIDVLLMQEVLRLSKDQLADRLAVDDYQLGHFDGASGLAIAVSGYSAFQPVADSARSEVIQSAELAGRLIRKSGVPMYSRLRQRGMIALRLAANPTESMDQAEQAPPAEQIVTIANTHPIIFVRALARTKQVRRIGQLLNRPYYQEHPLIVAGDMNHYPGPQAVDLTMRREAGLRAVELEEPTWRIRGSKHQWAAEIGSRLSKRELESFDAALDVILYRKLTASLGLVFDITSDHQAVAALFSPKAD